MTLYSLRSKPWLVLACAIALLSTACGNRLSRSEILAQNIVSDGGAAATRSAGSASGSNTGTAADASGTGAGGNAAVPAGGSGGAGAGTDQAAAGGATKQPIVIGLIGWLSGLGGSTLNPARDSWVAWQRSVNERGGINGHPVELLIGDDGGNPSVAVSLAQDFVNKGAIALTSVDAAIAYGDYAQSNSIPVIGTITGTEAWEQNPMLFPPFPATQSASWGAARLMKRAGFTKVAYMYCAETQDCKTGETRFSKWASEEGLELVYSGQYSVIAPDYTSDCLQLQQRGAQAVMPVGDAASMIRMAQNCSRQGYKPVWVTPTATDQLAKIPEFEGAIGVTGAFPWFVRSGAPAIDEYVAALQTYAPDRLTNGVSYQAWGWQSAKLLEAALANVSDQPTSQAVLNGLWAMQGETLGGLAPGGMALTFTANQPTADPLCVFDIRIQGGSWVLHGGLTPICK